jgi:hypothetical protein
MERLRMAALAIAAALFALPLGQSNAHDASPCGPYRDARVCLDAVRAEAKDCVDVRFDGKPTDAQLIECVNKALVKTGAFDIGDLPSGEWREETRLDYLRSLAYLNRRPAPRREPRGRT